MIFSEREAKKISIEWNLSKTEIAKWREKNRIPDTWALHLNFAKPHRLIWYFRLLNLIGSGWLNAEEVCRHYHWHKTKLSDLMSYQRNPQKLKPRTLYGEEIDAITHEFLAPLQTMVNSALERAKATPADHMYDEELQADLALILQIKVLRTSRCRQGFTEQDNYKLRALEKGTKKMISKYEDKNLLRDCFRQLGKLQDILNQAVPVDTEILTSNGL